MIANARNDRAVVKREAVFRIVSIVETTVSMMVASASVERARRLEWGSLLEAIGFFSERVSVVERDMENCCLEANVADPSEVCCGVGSVSQLGRVVERSLREWSRAAE